MTPIPEQSAPQPAPVTTHTFNFINGTGDHPNQPGTDHFRCDHCDRDLYEAGIRDHNGALRHGTISHSGAAATHPCEYSGHATSDGADR